MRAVCEVNPAVKPAQLTKVRELMDRCVLDCLVTGYETLIGGLELPDPDDRHVLAAAIRCGAQVIVTWNRRDFPESALRPYGIEAQHPDEFVAALLDLSPGDVCSCVRACRQRLKAPPASVDQYLHMLEKQGMLATVAELRLFAQLL
jgi:hypothetical protein